MKIHTIKTNDYAFLQTFTLESILLNTKIPILPNDIIMFLVNEKIAGMAFVHNVIEKDNERVLEITFEQAFLEENRISIFDSIFNKIFDLVSNEIIYSFSFEESSEIFKIINSLDSDFGFFLNNIESLLEEAKEFQEIKSITEAKENNRLHIKTPDFKQYDEHQKAQFIINEIGHICSMRTWTATNDKNRTYKGNRLGQYDTTFPELDMPIHAQQRVELIDNVWIKDKRPICAFEVETTTSIYSGLLRLADLATVLSTSNLNLYIVAPKKRVKKFINEIQRPLFESIHLDKYCHFISIESLELLYEKIKGLNGHVDYQVLEVIHQSAKQLEKIHLRGE